MSVSYHAAMTPAGGSNEEASETYTIPVASGLIAGESIMGVLIAVFSVVYELAK